MTPVALSIVGIAVLFLGTALRGFHLGMVALPAAAGLAIYSDLGLRGATDALPVDFLILIIGVTLFFAVAQANGTVDWIVSSCVRLARGRTHLLPWLVFGFAAAVTAMGTLPVATIAITAPLAFAFAAKYKTPPITMAVIIMAGYIATAFSPLSVYGLTLTQLYDRVGITTPVPVTVFLTVASVVVCLVLSFGSYYVIRRSAHRASTERTTAETVRVGGDAVRPGTPAAVGGTGIGETAEPDEVRLTPPRLLTLIGFLVLVVGGVAFKLDLGYLALTLAVLLQLALRITPGDVITRIPWSVVLLVTGILTYISVMQEIGTFTWLNEALTGAGSPALILLLVCYVGAVTSFFANSVAVLVTLVPMLPGLVAAGVSPMAAMISVALTCVLVDINPLGAGGAIIMGSVEPAERDRLFRHLMIFGLSAVALAPLLMCAAVLSIM